MKRQDLIPASQKFYFKLKKSPKFQNVKYETMGIDGNRTIVFTYKKVPFYLILALDIKMITHRAYGKYDFLEYYDEFPTLKLLEANCEHALLQPQRTQYIAPKRKRY